MRQPGEDGDATCRDPEHARRSRPPRRRCPVRSPRQRRTAARPSRARCRRGSRARRPSRRRRPRGCGPSRGSGQRRRARRRGRSANTIATGISQRPAPAPKAAGTTNSAIATRAEAGQDEKERRRRGGIRGTSGRAPGGEGRRDRSLAPGSGSAGHRRTATVRTGRMTMSAMRSTRAWGSRERQQESKRPARTSRSVVSGGGVFVVLRLFFSCRTRLRKVVSVDCQTVRDRSGDRGNGMVGMRQPSSGAIVRSAVSPCCEPSRRRRRCGAWTRSARPCTGNPRRGSHDEPGSAV